MNHVQYNTVLTIKKETKVITNVTQFPGKKRKETKWVALSGSGHKVIERDTLPQLLEQIPKYLKNYEPHHLDI